VDNYLVGFGFPPLSGFTKLKTVTVTLLVIMDESINFVSMEDWFPISIEEITVVSHEREDDQPMELAEECPELCQFARACPQRYPNLRHFEPEYWLDASEWE